MNDKKRRRIFGLLFLFLSLCIPVLLTVRLVRQEQRDQALIKAIIQSDTTQVQTLLAQGADANARQAPPDERIDWRWLWDRIRHRRLPSHGQTALEISLRYVLDSTLAKHPHEQVAILQMLLEHGAYKIQGVTPSHPEWKKLERELVEAGVENDVLKEDPLLPWTVKAEEEGCRNLLLDSGPSEHGFMVLGNCQLLQEHYADAANTFYLARLWSPISVESNQAWSQTAKLLEVQKSLSTGLPVGDSVLQVRPYPLHSGETLWLAVIGNVPHDDNAAADSLPTSVLSSRDVTVNKIRIALYRESDRGWRCLLQAPLHGHPATMHRSHTDVSEVVIRTLRRPEEAEPEIVTQLICVGASWAPSHMDIFAWNKGTLKRVLDVDSSGPLWMEDRHHDGRLEVQNEYEIGTQMCHAEMPRWSDIYAWRNGGYVLANSDFPEKFQHWPKELKSLLKRYPTDKEIWQHLGQAYTILHQPQAAQRAYQTAQRVHPAE